MRTVELGRDYLVLTYGTVRKTHSIKLIHAKISKDKLAAISRKVLHETGIKHVIIGGAVHGAALA